MKWLQLKNHAYLTLHCQAKVYFGGIFKNCIKKTYPSSNTFWPYQHRVKYAQFQCYSHLKSQNFKGNTLQTQLIRFEYILCHCRYTRLLLRHTQVLHTSQEKRNHHHLKNDALLRKVNVVSDTTILQQHSMTTRLGSYVATGQFLSSNFWQ